MDLGAFSVSLAVRDIDTSVAFYGHLGFEIVGGDRDHGWLILRQGTTTIGLFQGMFEGNLLTFNPGWDAQAQAVDEFTDIRVIQQGLQAAGIAFLQQADESTTGPASFVIQDPDGNTILVDQHV